MHRFLLLLAAAAASLLPAGCASITNPVADGIPVRRLPAEVLGRPQAPSCGPIPLTALKQPELDPYRLDKGDVLAVIADNLIAPDGQIAPFKLPDLSSNTAALGYPIPVSTTTAPSRSRGCRTDRRQGPQRSSRRSSSSASTPRA